MRETDNVIVMLDDTEHPETFCEVSVAGQICLRVSEHEGARVRDALLQGESPDRVMEIVGIAGERHTYLLSWIIGVSTNTKAGRHACTLRELQDEEEQRETKRTCGKNYE